MNTETARTNPYAVQPPAPVPQLTYTQAQAAQAIGVSTKTLQRWTQQGKVPHFREDRVLRYPVKALERWLNDKARLSTE